MSVMKQIVRSVIPDSLLPTAKKIAVAAKLLPDPQLPNAPFEYPFRELMAMRSPRPNYRWGVFCAALAAKALGLKKISVIEFGVAGGNGLVFLEEIAEEATRRSGVEIEVYGFDTGTGLPKPQDYRDLPQMWREGFYGMDVPALKQRLKRAQLVLGPVSETVPKFIKSNPAPVGFIAFDMDLYSSTTDAFQLFRDSEKLILPRVVCYFDDIIGFSHSDFTGERLAISEFNTQNKMRKISQIYGLKKFVGDRGPWLDMMFLLHAFDHSSYCESDGWHLLRELPLVEG